MWANEAEIKVKVVSETPTARMRSGWPQTPNTRSERPQSEGFLDFSYTTYRPKHNLRVK